MLILKHIALSHKLSYEVKFYGVNYIYTNANQWKL